VTATDADGTYNAEPYAATATVVGIDTTASPTLEGVSPTFTYYVGSDASGQNLGRTAPTNAGTYTVVASFPGSTDYTSAQSQPVTFTISAKAASVTPDAVEKTFGSADPVLTGALSGFIAGDGVTASYIRTAGETAGMYMISAMLSPAAVLSNYAITYNTAGFTINQATPTITVTDSGGICNGSAFPATAMVTGVSGQPTDSLETIPLTVTYYAGGTASGTGSTTAPSVPGTYTAVARFPGSTDYTPAQSPAVTFAILPNTSSPIGTEILDNGQPGFWSSAASTWTTSSSGLDGESLVSSTTPGSKSSQAAWWFSVPAGVYDVAITYSASSSLTTQLTLDVYDGVGTGTWKGGVVVNERVAPSDYTDQGVNWKRLGSFKFTNNIIHISTWNSATDGNICIDAIELRAAPMINDGDASGLKASDNFSTTGTWTTNTTGAFGNSHVSSGATGACTATWTLPVAPGNAEIDATWVASSSLSTSATYNIYDGSTLLKSVAVNQQNAPSGVTDEGIAWTDLGVFSFTSQVTVTLTNSAGQVCADAVRILPACQPSEMIANTYPGSWISATGWTATNQGLFGQALVSNTANGSRASQAAWWFPCEPGQYEVDVTWQPDSSYSQNVGFDVYNGGTYPGSWIKTCAVNEQNAPVGVTDQGVTWQSLGVFTMTTDVLHVSLWNSETDGAICIDGVRIVPVGTSAASDEPAASAAMAVAAALVGSPAVAAPADPNLTTLPPTVTAVAAVLSTITPVPGSGTALGTCQAALDPRTVDQIELPSLADSQAGLLGLDDLDASLDLLMSEQLGAGVRRLL